MSVSRPLAELEAERDALELRVSELTREIYALRDAASPFKVGDVVLASVRGGPYQDAEISDVRYTGWSNDPYWYRVNWRKKDGTFGKHNHRVFGDVVEKT